MTSGTRSRHPDPMKDFVRTRLAAFRHAFEGWWYLLRTQRNAWIHAVITVAVVALGFWLGLPRGDWVAIVLAIALVWLAEFLNTALEAVVDLASPEHHALAKVGHRRGSRRGTGRGAHGRAFF